MNRFGLWRLVFISCLLLVFTFGTFYWLIHHGATLELARTAAVNVMIIGQTFYLVNSRFLFQSSFSLKALTGNRLVPISITAVAALQIGFTYLPFMNSIFGSAPLPATLWKWLLLGGFVFFIIVELEKLLARLLQQKN